MLKYLHRVLFAKQHKRDAQLTKLVERLSLDEAILAHNQLTYGGLIGSYTHALHRNDFQSASPKKAYRDIEVVVSLYNYVMSKKGSPITRSEKNKYRMGLTSNMASILRDRSSEFSQRLGKANQLLEPFCLEHTDFKPENSANMDEVIVLMKRAVS